MPLNINIFYSGLKVCRCVKKSQNCDPGPSQVLNLEFGMSRMTFLTYTSISSPPILSLPTPGWSSYSPSSKKPSVSFTLAFGNQGTRPKISILLYRIQQQQYRERVVETGYSLQGNKLTMCFTDSRYISTISWARKHRRIYQPVGFNFFFYISADVFYIFNCFSVLYFLFTFRGVL